MVSGVDPSEWRKVLDLANGGEISLHPDVGRGLDKVCDDFLGRLDAVFELAYRVQIVSGFGPFPSGKALEAKFTAKGSGTDQSIDAIVLQHIDSVKLMKEVVAKAISNFEEQDQNRADKFTGLDIPS